MPERICKTCGHFRYDEIEYGVVVNGIRLPECQFHEAGYDLAADGDPQCHHWKPKEVNHA